MIREKDLDRLQGSWRVATLEVDGQSMPSELLANARIVIKGARFLSTGMGADYEGTLELNASSEPRHVNMKFEAGPEKGNTNLGIYELDRDSLRLCLATRGAVRPSKFATTPGSGFALEKLIRGDAPATTKSKKRSPGKAALPPGGKAAPTDSKANGAWSPQSWTAGQWKIPRSNG